MYALYIYIYIYIYIFFTLQNVTSLVIYVVHARQTPFCNILSKFPASIFHVLLMFKRNISLMTQQFVVTHTIRQAEIPAYRQLGYKHTFWRNVVQTVRMT